MKFYPCFILLFLCYTFSCPAQDTTKGFSKHSIALTGGMNLTYVTNAGSAYYGTAPCVLLNYRYVIHSSKISAIGIEAGAGYAAYSYYNGAWGEGILAYENYMHEIELNSGFFTNFNVIKNKVRWFSELGVAGDILCGNYNVLGEPIPFVGNRVTLNLYYETGIGFKIGGRIHLMPVISFSLARIIKYNELWWPNSLDPANPDMYNDVRIGIDVSYSFARE